MTPPADGDDPPRSSAATGDARPRTGNGETRPGTGAGGAPLVFTTRGAWVYAGGAVGLLLGGGACWLALARPGGENAWVPWVVGVFFSGLGLFTLLSRSRVVFDPASRRWRDSWGILFLEFSDEGSFDRLEKIRIEESEGTRGSITRYVSVVGSPNVELIVDIAEDDREADRIAEELRAVLELPVETVRT